jgi:4-alpha-glucanotransferase
MTINLALLSYGTPRERTSRMQFPRSSGILCHPTSFPSRYGIGDLGDGAERFLDWMARADQHLWQVLPLGPTGFGDSPYQSFSAFAGNPLVISPDRLVADGLLLGEALDEVPDFPAHFVDYARVVAYKEGLFRHAFAHFSAVGTKEHWAAFEAFRHANAWWLDDYALFMAVRAQYPGQCWHEWPWALVARDVDALTEARERLIDEVDYHAFLQWQFFTQWDRVRARAHDRGIRIIGDIPLFVAEESADVWATPAGFRLDKRCRPTVVAGVPPDYFSKDGQRWGNPHYAWEQMAEDGYAWWTARLRQTLAQVDIVRIDHFIGLATAWEVPAAHVTARHGRWVPGPGAALLSAFHAALGSLPLIAEDLGEITPEVVALRQQFGIPGMRILQYGFPLHAQSPHLPHNFTPDSVVYPGTHDNNTTLGWYWEQDDGVRRQCQDYFKSDGVDIAWDFLRAAWSSVGVMAIASLQDLLRLGGDARMNRPGATGGNWQWRYTPEMLSDWRAGELAWLTGIYERRQ